MNGEVFSYEGRTGSWVFTIYRTRADDESFCAVADISLFGEHRCKLVLSRPRTAGKDDIELLKLKCFTWIENAENEIAGPLS